MRLLEALSLGSLPRLAFVGAGGKTTAMFQLGRQMLGMTSPEGSKPIVLLSASTHLATDQLGLADYHYPLSGPGEVVDIWSGLPEGLVLFTGALSEKERTSGLDLITLSRIYELANAAGYPLLIEADGSRRRPLKAPARNEPVIPPWIETVVVVAGLSGLGHPLTTDWVHRPDIFSTLSELAEGKTITPQAISRVLAHPQGGLKGIPSSAKRRLLLNQADTIELQSYAKGMAGELLGFYQSVLVSALAPKRNAGLSEGVKGDVFAVHQTVAGIVLAAGASSRLGEPKQTLLWRGEPLVRHVARAALQAGLSPVLVVTGHAREQVEAALLELPVCFVHNPDWMEGQSSSIIAGLSNLTPEAGGAVFLLADQPQVSAELVRGLVALHARTLSPLVAPQIDGQRGNPVLFDRVAFPDLFALQGDVGGRSLFSKYSPAWLPWHDPSALLDVDNMDDYQRLLKLG